MSGSSEGLDSGVILRVSKVSKAWIRKVSRTVAYAWAMPGLLLKPHSMKGFL